MDHSDEEGNSGADGEKWGLPLRDLYKLALGFYKEKSGKAIHLSYEDNLRLVAFSQQAKFGPFNHDNFKDPGLLDYIGQHRKIAWQNLKNLSKLQSMEGFIDLLDSLSQGLFRPFVEAIKKDREEKLRKQIEDEKKRKEEEAIEKLKQEEEKRIEAEKNQEEIKKRQLQDLLNQQTYVQFRQFSEKQYPNNPEKQAILIRSLQNEHFHQYIKQIQHFGSECENKPENLDNSTFTQENINEKVTVVEDCDSDNESNEETSLGLVQPANLWTRHDIKEFKRSISSGKGDGIIRISHGETCTVRVPTLDGSCLFWEFATDSFDIGFGVYFEWLKPETTEVSVQISDSDDEENENDDNDDEESIDDLESGTASQLQAQTSVNKPPISIIIPVYRRESNLEVYAGSHVFPGIGTYLLKFDNSYSLWRSKTVYFKIFYTR